MLIFCKLALQKCKHTYRLVYTSFLTCPKLDKLLSLCTRQAVTCQMPGQVHVLPVVCENKLLSYLSYGGIDAIELSYKDGCYGLVERCPVHVDGGADWEAEPDHRGSHALDFHLKVLSNGAGGGWRVVSIDQI